MIKSNPRRALADVEEEVLERLPWWRRELLRMRDRAQAKTRNKEAAQAEDEPDG